jgi:LysR family hydrogen peroxide-inducible transcriptional activator
VTLVERTKRAVRFTPLGNAVVAKAHRLLREAEELSDMVQSAGQPLSGEVRMSVIPTIAPFLLPRMLPRLRRERPALKLLPARGNQRGGHRIAAPWAQRLRAAGAALPTGEVEKETIELDALFVAFPKDDPRDPPAEIAPELIDENRLLLLEDGHCLKEHALAACNRPELRASATMIGTSLHTLVQMVDNGLGLTMLPEMALDAGILNGTDVVARPLKSDNANREIALVWRKNSPRGGIPAARRGASRRLTQSMCLRPTRR